MKKKETIRSLWMPTARPLDGARRAAMLLVMLFTAAMATTATAQTITLETLTYDEDETTQMPKEEGGTAVIRTGYYPEDTYTSPCSWDNILNPTNVRAVAIPNPGFRFKEWQVSGEGSGLENMNGSYNKEAGISNVTANVTLTAVFIRQRYSITIAGSLSGVTGEAMPNDARMNETVTLSFSGVPEGKVPEFSITYNFSGDNYPVYELKDNGDGTFSFPMPDGDVTVTFGSGFKNDIKAFRATVPNQITNGNLIFYKFESANTPSNGVIIGETVTNGTTTLVLGTDYKFGSVTYANGDSGDPGTIGDECLVEVKGIGDYAGILYAPFTIISPSANGTYGDLSWSVADGTLSITGTGAMTAAATTAYPWYQYRSIITTISIGDGVTSIADNAFGSIQQNIYTYSNVAKVTIPASVTSIGADAFKGCITATDVYCYADPTNLTWGDTGDDFKSDGSTKCHVADASAWSSFSSVNVTFEGDLAEKSIPYIDADGNMAYCTDFTVLTGSNTTYVELGSNGKTTWYVVNSDVEYINKQINLVGDVNLILCDGKTMTSNGGSASAIMGGNSLTIYGQTAGTGTLKTFCGEGSAICSNAITINGGTVNAIGGNTTDDHGICASGNVTINGGNVSATGNFSDSYGIFASGDVTILGGTVVANGTIYSENGSVTIAEGMIDCTLSGGTKRVITEGATADATTAAAVNALLKGQTVSISYSRTYTTGSGSGKASTLCLPFDFVADADDGTYATFTKVTETAGVYEVEMTAVAAGTTLTAGTPYMFVPKASGKLTQGNTAYTVPVDGFKAASSATDGSWQFKGTFETKTWPSGQTHLYGFAGKDYYLSSGAQIAADDIGSFRRFDYGTCAAFRCYLLAPGASAARGVSKAGSLPETLKVKLVKADGTTTAIGTMDMRTGEVEFGEDWYDLNGRRLSGEPTIKGVYIHKGKKIKK